MCLSVALERPQDVISRGEHVGFEWMVVHNGMGYRCGYAKVPPGHPWHGKGGDDVEAAVHGGLSFARADVACAAAGAAGADDGWWLGFDAMHTWDAADPSLPIDDGERRRREDLSRYSPFGPTHRSRDVVRTTEYVEAQCRSLCEQAAAAAEGADG
jgi:hypothetical protein